MRTHRYIDSFKLLKELQESGIIPIEYKDKVDTIICLDKYKKVFEEKKSLSVN